MKRWRASFQFSLWDSAMDTSGRCMFIVYFQFSLWDSNIMSWNKNIKRGTFNSLYEILRFSERLGDALILFQFSLWDSSYNWREQDYYSITLSILFMRFFITSLVVFLTLVHLAFNSLYEIRVSLGSVG